MIVGVDELEEIYVVWVADEMYHVKAVVEKPARSVPSICHESVSGRAVCVVPSVWM